MTKFRKIDWLRHLYREAIQWTSGHSGRVQWHLTPGVRDPNNGSRFSLSALEICLPDKLSKCISNNQVPSVYKPEVEKFLKYINKVEKFNDKVIAEMVKIRKTAISLVEFSQNFVKLNASEKDLFMLMLPPGMGEQIDTILLKMRTMTASVAGVETPIPQTEENKKQFKFDDWLRHMYRSCLLWLSQTEGRLAWKSMDMAQDPNNKKKGARMKSDEVKQLLTKLAPQCLNQNVVPKPYVPEIEEVLRVSRERSQFKDLEVKERLRLIAVGLIDVIENAGPFKILQVCDTIGQVKDMLKDVQALEKGDGIESTEEQVEEPSNTLQVHDAMDHLEDKPSEGQGLEQFANEEENFRIEPLHDGTEELLDILDQAYTTEACSDQTVAESVQSNCQEVYPSSPSIGFSEGWSEVASPSSACSISLDGHVSDDSGISSPTGNHFGLEDPEIPEDLKIKEILDLNIEIPEEYADIDLDTLQFPDDTNNNDGCEDICHTNGRLKRKLADDFDKPSKKPRP